MAKCGIKNGEIRYCEDINEEYLIIGRTPMQKMAYRVLWKSGLRTHDMIEDIKKDKVVGKIEGFQASNKNMLTNFIKNNLER